MKRQVIACFVAAGLALAAAAYESVTVGDGESVTIGGDVTNADTVELTASAGATIVLPAASSGGNAYIYTRLILTGEGTVTLVAPSEDYTAKTVGIVGGVTAADTVTLHVAAPSVTAFKVGKSASETSVNYVMADIANVTFACVPVTHPTAAFTPSKAVSVLDPVDGLQCNRTVPGNSGVPSTSSESLPFM